VVFEVSKVCAVDVTNVSEALSVGITTAEITSMFSHTKLVNIDDTKQIYFACRHAVIRPMSQCLLNRSRQTVSS
jgi:hypothetical protein